LCLKEKLEYICYRLFTYGYDDVDFDKMLASVVNKNNDKMTGVDKMQLKQLLFYVKIILYILVIVLVITLVFIFRRLYS